MKSIFHKFAFVYILIFLIAFIIIIIGVRTVLDVYFVSHETELIIKRVSSYEALVNQRYVDKISLTVLQEQVMLLDGYTGANIWLFTEDGILYSTDADKELDISAYPELIRDMKAVFEGQTTSREVNYKDLYAESMLRVGYPFTVGAVTYAMFINVPMPEIEDTISKVSVIIFVSLAFSGVLAVALISLITRRMTREIKTIGQSAQYISKGNFDKKIRIERVDELGELAASFNAMADALNRQEQGKRAFISSLSHDLRTPLTTIKGYTQAILDGTIEGEKQTRYLNLVLSESERLIKMINDLLDLSKMESGALVLHKTDFDLNEMVLNVLDAFEQRVVEKSVKLHIDLTSEKRLAHGDYNALHRVMYNLLDNATKFVDVGGSISLRTELKGEKFYVGVSNTGRVLSPKELSLIWERFSKLDKSRGLEKASSGLGLSIVKEIIKAHREKIEVFSNEDIGVAFIFSVSTQIFAQDA